MQRLGLRFLLFVFCLGLTSPLWAASIVFLNPGKSGEEFWVSVSSFMQSAANDLGHELEIIYAERDAARMIANARAVAGREKKPDYLIAVNEKQVAPEILRMTADTGIKVFLLLNSITPEQKRELEKAGALGHFVGSLVPNNEEAGYQMAQALLAEARRLALPMRGGAYPLIAIGGDKATPASIEREAGLRRALAERPELRLTQVVYGEWNQERAREQMDILLARYPDARLVWAANDLMAFGAIQAAEARNIVPGQAMLFAGLNNSTQALQARIDGRLSVLAAGHFTAGGWAVVMLHDLRAGRNLDQAGGRERQDPLFAIISAQQARRLIERFGERGGAPVNFRQFSLAHNPKLKEYRFSLLPLLQ
jgi:ABC-type sugar transport system substrate-binding protein